MKIIVADDSTIVREGLVALLGSRGHEIVAAVSNAEEAVEAAAAAASISGVDIVIMDIRMPPTHTDEGVRAAVRIKRHSPHVGVMLFSQYAEVRWARTLLDVATSGVGYLLKDRVADVSSFIQSLHQVGMGQLILDPEVAAALIGAPRSSSNALDLLTARETDVLRLMAEGRSNAAIAHSLYLSNGSVEKNVTALFTKLGLQMSPHDHRRVLAVLQYLSS